MNTFSRTRARLLSLRPNRADLVDGGMLAALSVLALLGFRTTYSGWSYLAVGVAGLVLGLLIGHFANVLRAPIVVVAALAIAAYFLLGGALALRDSGGGVLPTPRTLEGLAEEGVGGWKDLLTTLPPVDGSGPLLVIPYALGLIAGAAGFTVARRMRQPLAALVIPALLLIAVIVLGTQEPASRLLQGAVFGVGCLVWVALRAARLRPAVQNESGRASRAVLAAVMLGVAGLGASAVGDHLPGVGGDDRTVLRTYVTPPFDIGDYPSPLVGFRKYTKPNVLALYEATLFTVAGLPEGQRVRIATLDEYNNSVWGASNGSAAGDASASFQRVGSQIRTAATGRTATLSITIGRYADVWLPDAGAVTGVHFTGRLAERAEDFRYNLATGTGVVPGRLARDDTYTLDVVLPDAVKIGPGTAPVGQPSVTSDQLGFLRTAADTWAKGISDPMQRLLAAAEYLRTRGAYTDGGTAAEAVHLAGHSAGRLTKFVNQAQPAGNDEQYAATFALMANNLGIPARVVLGAVPQKDGKVMGKDVRAWVEVRIAGAGWQPIHETAFMPDRTKKPDAQVPPQAQQESSVVVPPPQAVRPPSGILSADAANAQQQNQVAPKQTKALAGGFEIPWIIKALLVAIGPPLLLILLVCGLIIGLKARRRYRRRTSGTFAARLAHGWSEVLDYARDMGVYVPRLATRREQAVVLHPHGVGTLARDADLVVFGPGDPTEDAVTRYWSDVEIARKRMGASLGRWGRIRAALSLASLRRRPAGGI